MGKKAQKCRKSNHFSLHYRIGLIKMWIQKFKEDVISQNLRPKEGLDNLVKLGTKTIP